jgi:hypothetical protein
MSNRWRFAVRVCTGALVPSVLSAQVGHDPARSPFRDITTHQGLSIGIGRFAGNRTVAGVGARPGLMVGVRFDTRLSGPADLAASIWRIGSSRRVVDPTRDTTSRYGEPQDVTLLAADLGIMLNLTGAKTWRGLAPYVGIAAGVVSPTRGVTDASGYQLGGNFSLVPTLGTRVFVGRRFALRLEARDYYHRYEWPLDFYRTFTDANGNDLPPVLAADTPDRQWAHNFALSLGFTYVFTF